MMRWIGILGWCLVAGFSGPAAEAAQNPWSVRLFVAELNAGSGFHLEEGGEFLALSLAASTVAGAGVEYRIADRFGIELASLGGVFEIGLIGRSPAFGGSIVKRLEMTVETRRLGLAVHVWPGRRFDVAVIPALAHMRYGNLEVDLSPAGIREAVEFDNELTGALTVRAETAIGRWLLGVEATWIEASAEAIDAEVGDRRLVIGLDPVLVGVGVGYRF